MKRAIIVHGFRGKPATNWKPWLKKQLVASGFDVEIPEMPNPNHPLAAEWADKIKEVISSRESDELYLIGHSLGCMAILKYLEALPKQQRLKACIFVAGFGRRFSKYQGGHDSFFEHDLDWRKIKRHVDSFVAIHSRDDSNVGYEEIYVFADKLNAKVVLLDGMGHFGSQDGVYEAPSVLEAIFELRRPELKI